MKNKTWIFVITVIIIAVAIACIIIVRKKNTETPAVIDPVVVSTSTAAITIQPEMISIDEDSYLLGISGSYPKFLQADSAFNKQLADFVTSGVATFKKETDQEYQARLETGGDEFQKEFANNSPYTYQVRPEIIQSNDSIISVLIHIAGYSGGAHGYAKMTKSLLKVHEHII
jgi:hypothetical protein